MAKEEKASVWSSYTEADKEALEKLAAGYRDFLSTCKTERESVREAVRQAEGAGYRDLQDVLRSGEKLKAGDKVYAVNMKKSIVLFQIGEEPLEKGLAILGAHIDTCRLDVKQNPLYEDGGLAYLDTHYYGGIKKYQWVTLPLALHGVVVKKDGTVVEVCIGEAEGDPVFCVTDLLIHLSQEQMKKNAAKVIEGEDLDILVGNYPLKDGEKESVKAGVLKLIEEQYGIEEEDFLSAELVLVPAGRARDLGFDRSMILAYGQDDRVCAYTSLVAMLESDGARQRTSCCLLVDKEEIGSVGATGMQSHFFENILAELMNACAISARRTCRAAASPTPRCSRPMSRVPTMRSTPAPTTRRTSPTLAAAWSSTSSLALAASRAPTTPTPNTSVRFAACSRSTMSTSSWLSSAASTSAAAARLPTS